MVTPREYAVKQCGNSVFRFTSRGQLAAGAAPSEGAFAAHEPGHLRAIVLISAAAGIAVAVAATP